MLPDFSHYYEAVRYLEGLSNIASGPDYMMRPAPRGVRGKHDPSVYIKRMAWFLDLLGNPEKGFKFVHITGTAGKGTVAAMIQQALVRAGHRTGLFTSPFVTTSIEKIQVDDLYIAPDEFADIVESLKPAIDQAFRECPYGGPSYFERFLAIAFLYFKQRKCEWVVLEVGCGGRYDATNVIDASIVSAVTNIDYDHMHILGKTLNKIARDKAGIIKKGSMFFTTERRPRLLKIFETICEEQGARFHLVRGDNRELAEAMARAIELPAGIQEPHLPARFEVMQKRPLVIIDGAHNRLKMQNTVSKLQGFKFRKLHLVIALAANKQHGEILKSIAPYADAIYPTRFQATDRQCANPAVFAPGMRIYTDPHQALSAALQKARSEDMVLITGSFYLAGELRQRWDSEENILSSRHSHVFVD